MPYLVPPSTQVGLCAFFFSATAGKCLEMPDTWVEEGGYGFR